MAKSGIGLYAALGLALVGAFALGKKKAHAAPTATQSTDPNTDGIRIAVTDVPNAGTVEVLLRGGGAYNVTGQTLTKEINDRVIALALAAAGVPAPQISWASTLPGEGQS